MVIIYKQPKQTHIALITPEIGNLKQSNLGELANLLSGKGGGLGDVAAAMFTGLRDAGVQVSLFAPNFKTIYQKNSGLTPQEWREKRLTTDPQGIHLIDSRVFVNLDKIYGNYDINGGDLDLLVCSRFQENSRHALKELLAEKGGRLIADIQDFVGSGLLAAYLRSREVPFVQTMHNTHTKHVPLDYYQDFDLNSFREHIYFSRPEIGKLNHVDQAATGIKNSTIVKFVGEEFKNRIIRGDLDWDFTISKSVIDEVIIKNETGQVISIPNSISSKDYPENQDIPRIFSHMTGNIIDAKKQNKLALQKETGLIENENALLYVSTSRIDPHQKGVQHFPEAIKRIIKKHKDVQFFIIGDPTEDAYAKNIKNELIQLSLNSNGQVAYSPFNEHERLCSLAYASATDSFGASIKEPFGQNDIIGIINGGTATNNNIDGYKDKIKQLNISQIKIIGHDLKYFNDPKHISDVIAYVTELKNKNLFGNGFLFEGSNSHNLERGLEQSIKTNKFLQEREDIANAHARIRMIDGREEYKLDKMITSLVNLYTQIEKQQVDKQLWK